MIWLILLQNSEHTINHMADMWVKTICLPCKINKYKNGSSPNTVKGQYYAKASVQENFTFWKELTDKKLK